MMGYFFITHAFSLNIFASSTNKNIDNLLMFGKISHILVNFPYEQWTETLNDV